MAKGGEAKRSSCSKDLVAAQGTQHTRQCLGDLSLYQDHSCHHTIPFVEVRNEWVPPQDCTGRYWVVSWTYTPQWVASV